MTDDLVTHTYRSDLVGWLELIVSREGIRSISFVESEGLSATAELPALALKLISELDAYFAGKLRTFSVPLDPDYGTPFQRRVWAELSRIPYGETRSYRDIAASLGNPGLARAVGLANGSNPIPIVIPCHRVINADGTLGGYSSGIEIKRRLLKLEGVEL
jgi:methylated-DNA-[protein]-cysteine S-methyltransferase